MKKLFLSALVAVGLVSCVQEELVNTSNPSNEIAFSGYVGNQVRSAVDPSTTLATLDHFTVWAYVDESAGVVFNGELVQQANGEWSYDGPRYWAEGHNYRFFALTPYGKGNSHVTITGADADPYANGLGEITFVNENGTEDVLYASNVESTVSSIPEKVTFQFNHLLSKVKFTFTNGHDGKYVDLIIKNIKMEVPATATVDLDKSVKTQYAWGNHDGKLVLDFGHVNAANYLALGAVEETDNERLTIPAGADQKYKVTFTVEEWQNKSVMTEHNFETYIEGKELVAGTAYNFTAEITPEVLNLKKIVFDAKIDEWVEDGETPVGPIAGTVTHVATIDELQAALNADVEEYPYHILITEDLVGNVVAPEVANQKVTIDGQGHEFKGSVQINGKSDYNKATTVFENINFVSEDASTLVNGDSFIYCGTLNGNTQVRYPDNIIVKNCTFTATGNTAVGVKVWSLDHGQLVIEGGKADGVHSLLQVTSSQGANILVDGVEVVNAKNGISLGNAGNTVIKNSTISTAEYGIRANGDANAANLTIENSTITAKQPVIVRKLTKAGYVLNIDAATTLNTAEKYAVVFTKGSDDAAYVLPEVEFTCNVPDMSRVYPNDGHKPVAVTTAAAFVAAVNNVSEDGTIVISEDFDFTTDGRAHNSGSYYDGIYYIGDKSFTIDLNGKTVGNANGAVNDYLFNFKNDGTKANTITIKNGTLDAGTAAYCALCTSSTSTQELTINLENVNLINNISNGSTVKLRGHAVLNVKAGTKITGKNSYLGIECVASIVNIYDGAEIYQNGTSSYCGCLVGACGNGVVNVYGGYGKGAKGGFIAMTSGGTINVHGGEWIANTNGTVGNNSNVYVLTAQNNKYESGWCAPSIINVTGGTLRGGMDAWVLNDVTVEKAELNISGGNFNANPNHYLAEGHVALESNGVYTVVEAATVSTPEALAAAVANGGYVVLAEDVTLAEAITVEGATATIDLNGKTLTATTTDAIVVKSGANVTISGNGVVKAHQGIVRALGGKVIIEGGEFVQTGDYYSTPSHLRYGVDSREGGEIIVKGGTFNTINGMINASANSSVVIEGGNFNNVINSAITRHFAYVGGNLTIKGGVFESKANGSAGGTFFCGAASTGKVVVEGGKFTSLWVSGSKNNIWESYFGGSIEVKGGIFNHNGGISTQVTANTDAATAAAYPYMAK